MIAQQNLFLDVMILLYKQILFGSYGVFDVTATSIDSVDDLKEWLYWKE